MVRADYREMLAVHLVELKVVTHEVGPLVQLGLAVLFARARDDLERLAVEDIHVRHGARRVVLPVNLLQQPPRCRYSSVATRE